MTDPSAWRTTTYGEGTRRWVESMSATGRRQATRIAIAKLNDWTHGHNEDRPSRGELKAWFALLLADHHALQRRAADAERDFRELRVEFDAVTAQRDDLIEEERTAREASTIHAEDADRIAAQRDDALEMVKTLDADRTRRTKERDHAEQNLYERTVEWMKRYDELDEAYGQAEAERNTFAHENRRLREELVELRRDQVAAVCADVEEVEGRVECDHGVGVNFTTLRLTTPGGGAK